MAMVSVSRIKLAIVELLKTVTTIDGYNTQVPYDHVFPYFSTNESNRTDDAAFPKFFVVLDSGENHLNAGNRAASTLNFNIIAQFKKTTGVNTAVEDLENFLADLELLFQRNDTLGQVVQDAQLTDFYTDGGLNEPEAAGVFRIVVDRSGTAG